MSRICQAIRGEFEAWAAGGDDPEKLAAARSLLPEHSISAIARMVGVSRGTLYAHIEAWPAGRRIQAETIGGTAWARFTRRDVLA